MKYETKLLTMNMKIIVKIQKCLLFRRFVENAVPRYPALPPHVAACFQVEIYVLSFSDIKKMIQNFMSDPHNHRSLLIIT